MLTVATRVGRWPLALTLVVLGACADEPTTTNPIRKDLAPRFTTNGIILVTNTSGGTEVGSLRWAASQVSPLNPRIEFDPSLAGDTITLQAGLDVPGALDIVGPADKGITISGGGQYPVMRATQGVAVTNVTITGGVGAPGYVGSAISTDGVVWVVNSTVRNNGGGAAIHGGTLMTIINSTVSNNTSYGVAGIEYGYRTVVRLINSTVVRNGPGTGMGRYGGWYDPEAAPVTVRNSIIAYNGTPLRNCHESFGFVFEAMNIVTDYSCGGNASVFFVDPALNELADNGGPTTTAAPAQYSAAINMGVACDVTVDQRYVPREAKCDIGAVEFNDYNVVTMTLEPNAPVDLAGSVTIKGTVQCVRPEDTLRLGLQVNQTQKVGRTSTVVRGAAELPVNCTTTATPWTAVVAPWSGTFKDGTASVSAHTIDPPVWVTPAYVQQAVRFARAKK